MSYRHFHTSLSPSSKVSRKQTPLERLRSTVLKIQERTSQFHKLRNSCSTNTLRNAELTESTQIKQPCFQSKNSKSFKALKDTLDILESKVNLAKQELIIANPSMKKKNVAYLEIDDKINEKPETINKDISDSNITKKIREKKVDSFANKYSKPKILSTSERKPYSPRNNSLYYINEVVRAINEKNSLALNHVNTSIKMMKACEVYQIPSLNEIQHKRLKLKKSEKDRQKKSLVLDLDETLIHCLESNSNQADLKLQLNIEGSIIKIAVNIRPYAITFLKKMASIFQIIIFTASHQVYANAILDEIDPDGQIFQHRLYREHCFTLGNDLYVKDLRILNRDLANVVLVDNAAYSYCFQLQNGIPIFPFYEGSDYELAALQKYLMGIEKEEDVREYNKKTFKLHHYSKFFSGEELIEQLYINNFH